MDEYSGSMGSDADVAALVSIVGEVEGAVVLLTAAQVAEVRALARAGQLAARQAAGSPAVVRAHDMALRSVAAELGGVLRVTDRTVQSRIDEARDLVEHYPATLVAWETGRIMRGHVRVITDAGSVLVDASPERRAEFEAAAIARCERDTPNRVRSEIEILAERFAERSFTDRHRDAAAERRVRVVPGAAGMSDLIATLPTVIADGIIDRLTQQAQIIVDAREPGNAGSAFGARGAGGAASAGDSEPDRRGIDQVRADVFSDLLLAGAPALDPTATGDGQGSLGAIRAQVQVIVPALTLLGVDDGPADLVGRSPIDAETARCLAGNTHSWARVLTDPVEGTVLAVDRYRTPWPQRRFLRARDQHCRFPGCRRAAIRCEIDHTIDAAKGGPTALWNLAHLCQRHHSMKQFTRWKVRQLPDGVLEWTSPTGRIYREDAPAPPVAFTPASISTSAVDEPPPF
ncbi:DUF222 domain-containing protein [Microbacterium sp. 2C]|uniref:HNH endonuclease signature motif containing protein n=1 Tax=Microbacterium paulum TaxID=2707006 RepID=UPI0018C2A4AA|nr:HNH endonuclease signature motif containing protein [Microbacterium paulum]MBG0718144.1 DUF222 domain-containing protein [Microbacterium paulum]